MPQVSEFGFEGSNHGMANSAGWHHGREKPVLGPLSVAMTDAKYEVVREFQFGITRRLEHATPVAACDPPCFVTDCSFGGRAWRATSTSATFYV